MGFVVTTSSPMEGEMCVHMLQQSAWKSQPCSIHSSRAIALMVGKKIVISRIPLSACSSAFHILSFPPAPQESAFCLPPEDSPSPGHHVTSVAFSFHLKDTGKHEQHGQESWCCLSQARNVLVPKIKWCLFKPRAEPPQRLNSHAGEKKKEKPTTGGFDQPAQWKTGAEYRRF